MDKREKFSYPEKNEKQQRWDGIASKVDKTVDKLEKPVDPDIKESIVALNAFGINTTASCEGHIDHGTYAPYIDVEAKDVEMLDRQARELEDKEENINKAKNIFKEIEQKNLEEREKLFLLLDEFYKNRNVSFSTKLIVKGLARGWSRLESQGADLQKIKTKEERQENLSRYQEEMAAFTDFLTKKYFEEKR
ncbi:MAG: hypothetical protein M1334_01820 [Patescibacteria group bacterium]|nr:hypothetical protein [Patescibacteria group bacterium]